MRSQTQDASAASSCADVGSASEQVRLFLREAQGTYCWSQLSSTRVQASLAVTCQQRGCARPRWPAYG